MTSPTVTGPTIHEASLGPGGAVIKGARISQADAEKLRRTGRDVVVCGPNGSENRRIAGLVEANANGRWTRHTPHRSAGPHALPHFQPNPRPPAGHAFYETAKLKAR